MSKFKYYCVHCRHHFDRGKIITGSDGKEYERCPNCGSWNYGLTNLVLIKLDNGLYTVNYESPSLGMTLFSSYDESEIRRVKNRFWNLKWDIFREIMLSGQIAEHVRMYLDNMPCLMNNYIPFQL